MEQRRAEVLLLDKLFTKKKFLSSDFLGLLKNKNIKFAQYLSFVLA